MRALAEGASEESDLLTGAEMATDATLFPFVSPCSSRRTALHCTLLVAAPRGSVNLSPLVFIPVPWSSLLDCFERSFLSPPCFEPVCCTPLSFRQRGYHPDPTLVLHCHCSKPYSLECWARAAWMRGKLQRYVTSLEWNARYPLYRALVNSRQAVEFLMYLGSAFVPQGHFLYVAVRTGVYVTRLARMAQREPTSFGLPFFFFIDTEDQGHVLVLKCRFCIEHGLSRTSCAERLARVLQRMCRALGAPQHECGYRYEQPGARLDVYRHDRAVERFHRYGLPLDRHLAFYPYFYLTRRLEDETDDDDLSEDSSWADDDE